MKDDYRWYNSVLFEQRDEFLKRLPELEPQIYNNKSLKPFLQRPDHLVMQDKMREAGVNSDGTTSDPYASTMNGDGKPKVEAKLMVCCPQGKSIV